MTPLRQKMIENMQLHGLSEKTQELYVRYVRQLADYYQQSPSQLSEKQVRQFILYLQNEKKVAPATCAVVIAALKFFYHHTIERKWPLFNLLRPRREKKLPVVLSQEEVQRILDCIYRQRHRVCLVTIYSCGLRIREATRLQVHQIDSEYMRLHIYQGKGNKDRYVPLPQHTLDLLRKYWVTHRHAQWIFPGKAGRGHPSVMSKGPVSASTINRAFNAALTASGVQNRLPSTHYVTLGPHIYWKLVFTYASFKLGWATNISLLPRCIHI